MKNTILWSTLFTLIGTQVYAEETQSVTPASQAPSATMNAPTPAPIAAPAAAPTPAPQQTTPVVPAAAPQTQAIPSVAPAPAPTSVINCDYKIPPQVKKVEQATVLTWSENAVTQAFSFDPATLDVQMQKLQACFTEQGWTGFNTALQKSGNIEAIKSQKLIVTSKIDGLSLMNNVQDNQWKLTLPIVVVYQNEKEKVSQLLSVDLTVTRKPNGDLGITQMIAAPRGTVTTKKPEPVVTNPENTSLDTKPAQEDNRPPLGKPQP